MLSTCTALARLTTPAKRVLAALVSRHCESSIPALAATVVESCCEKGASSTIHRGWRNGAELASRLSVRGRLEKWVHPLVWKSAEGEDIVGQLLVVLGIVHTSSTIEDWELKRDEKQLTQPPSLAASRNCSGLAGLQRAGSLLLRDLARKFASVATIVKSPPSRSLAGYVISDRRGRRFSLVLCMDKQPKFPALKLFFNLEGNDSSRRSTKAGYILCAMLPGSLALRGLRISPSFRGAGLSVLFIATWALLCRKLGCEPTTKTLDKPLLSLALKRLGFRHCGGFEIEIACRGHPCSTTSEGSGRRESLISVREKAESGHSESLTIWSQNHLSLVSRYSKSYLKSQGIVVVKSRPKTSKKVHVFCTFSSPDAAELDRCIAAHAHISKCLFYSARVVAFMSSVQLPFVREREAPAVKVQDPKKKKRKIGRVTTSVAANVHSSKN